MTEHRIYTMPFASVYPHYVTKVERKGRTVDELHTVICWLTGYSQTQVQDCIANNVDFRTFFAKAPCIHPNASKITGTICGVNIQEIEDPLMKNIRYLDKLVDELAKGKTMEKILRT